MLFLCQHSHYVSANSKPLLYLFRVYDIFYTLLFLIIFFCSLILDVPCLYHQPTAKLPISSFPPLVSLLLRPSHSRRVSSPRRVPPTHLSLPLSLLSRFINSIVLLIYHHPFVCRYNIIIGNIIPSLLMQLLFSIALPSLSFFFFLPFLIHRIISFARRPREKHYRETRERTYERTHEWMNRHAAVCYTKWVSAID